MTGIVILAAGAGRRINLGYNKMLFELNKKPLYQITIDKFESLGYQEIILVVNEDDYDVIKTPYTKVIGGKTRGESVLAGLKKIKSEKVIIHDGARPFISTETIIRVEESLTKYNACFVGHKITDTVKKIGSKIETLDRETLVAAETPQAGVTKLLLETYEKALKNNIVATDDMSIIEQLTNEKIDVIISNENNMKITTKEDLNYAKYLLETGDNDD